MVRWLEYAMVVAIFMAFMAVFAFQQCDVAMEFVLSV